MEFKETCEVTFNNNSATQCGAAIYSSDNSHVTFMGNSNVKFTSNFVFNNPRRINLLYGGIIYSMQYGTILFDDNSTVVFSDNHGGTGGAMHSSYYGHIFFTGNSIILFSNNSASVGGAIHSNDYCKNYIIYRKFCCKIW